MQSTDPQATIDRLSAVAVARRFVRQAAMVTSRSRSFVCIATAALKARKLGPFFEDSVESG